MIDPPPPSVNPVVSTPRVFTLRFAHPAFVLRVMTPRCPYPLSRHPPCSPAENSPQNKNRTPIRTLADPWDRRVTNTYLEEILTPRLTDEKERYELAPGFAPLYEGSYKDYARHVEESPAESPVLSTPPLIPPPLSPQPPLFHLPPPLYPHP